MEYAANTYRNPGKINFWDLLIIFCLLLFAAAFQYLRWQGTTPFIFLGSDAANHASFAAALDHPGIFQKDEGLSDTKTFQFYATVHIPLIRILAKILGDYGTAYISMLGFFVFIQTLGFYILGRLIFQSRFWGLMLAIITIPQISVFAPGEFWGLYPDPIPRVAFQSFFPLIIAAAYHWRERVALWPLLMLFAGLMMYLHPVSAPSVAMGVWFGFWLFLGSSWSWPKRIGYMLLLGALFIAVTIPFMARYFSSHDQGKTADFALMMKIFGYRFSDYIEIPIAIKRFFLQATHVMLLPFAVAGAIVVFRYRRSEPGGLRLIGMWSAGILTASFLVPFVIHSIAKHYGMLPPEADLERGVRYIYPIGLLLWLWPLAEISRHLKKPEYRKIVIAVGLVAITGWWLTCRPLWMMEVIEKVSSKVYKAETRHTETSAHVTGIARADVIDLMKAIHDLTPTGAGILPAVTRISPMPIRYYSLRSVVLCYKDGGLLSYGNHARAIKWYHNWQKMVSMMEIKDKPRRIEKLAAFAKELGADYLLVDSDIPESGQESGRTETIFSNKAGTLLYLR